jgi:hypothetical protein
MAVVTWGNAIVGTGPLDLFELQPAVMSSGLRKPGLQKTTAAAATEIVGPVGSHVDEILFPHTGFGNKSKFFGDGIAQGFSHQLTGVLDRKLHFPVVVPFRTDLQPSFPYPFGIVFDDAFDFEIVLNVEFFQSDPDREKFVPSLRVEPDLVF